MDTVSKKWTLLLINALGNKGKLRYARIAEELKGVRPKALTSTLRELERYRLIKREVYPEVPRRVEYSLTEDGLNLKEAIIPLLKWAASKSKTNIDSCPILKSKN